MPHHIWQHGWDPWQIQEGHRQGNAAKHPGPAPAGPWVKEVRDQHHAEGAPLGNATGVVMSITKAPSNGVVMFAAGVKVFRSKKGARREPPNAT